MFRGLIAILTAWSVLWHGAVGCCAHHHHQHGPESTCHDSAACCDETAEALRTAMAHFVARTMKAGVNIGTSVTRAIITRITPSQANTSKWWTRVANSLSRPWPRLARLTGLTATATTAPSPRRVAARANQRRGLGPCPASPRSSLPSRSRKPSPLRRSSISTSAVRSHRTFLGICCSA